MDVARLKSIPLFAQLSRRERKQVAQLADEVDVEAGDHLIEQGELAYEFFVIEEGTAEVTRDGQHLREMGPGDFFGEIALVEADLRTASVVAKTPMKLIVMFGANFRALRHTMPELADEITRAIEERQGRD